MNYASKALHSGALSDDGRSVRAQMYWRAEERPGGGPPLWTLYRPDDQPRMTELPVAHTGLWVDALDDRAAAEAYLEAPQEEPRIHPLPDGWGATMRADAYGETTVELYRWCEPMRFPPMGPLSYVVERDAHVVAVGYERAGEPVSYPNPITAAAEMMVAVGVTPPRPLWDDPYAPRFEYAEHVEATWRRRWRGDRNQYVRTSLVGVEPTIEMHAVVLQHIASRLLLIAGFPAEAAGYLWTR